MEENRELREQLRELTLKHADLAVNYERVNRELAAGIRDRNDFKSGLASLLFLPDLAKISLLSNSTVSGFKKMINH